MKALTERLMVMFALMPMALEVSAHSGHDHGHWGSSAVHAALFISIAAIVGVGAWTFRKHRNQLKKEENR